MAEREKPGKRLDEHSHAIAALVGIGRRLDYRIWISREEQKRPWGNGTLGRLLTTAERCASPAALFGGVQAADVDVIWYDGRGTVWLFEVEWSAMLSQAVVGRRLPIDARRHLVVVDERVPLIQSKLHRGPWLRQCLEADGWEFIKLRHLLAYAERGETDRFGLASIVGLQPPIEEAQGQLPLM